MPQTTLAQRRKIILLSKHKVISKHMSGVRGIDSTDKIIYSV